jgi:hypothetical protein
MGVVPLKSIEPDPLDEFSDLYSDVKGASAHELEMAVGAVKPPKFPIRDVHPIMKQFSSLNDEDYYRLRDDIKTNGQRKAICMFQGMIWDGRARYDACIDLRIVPKVFILRREDPVIYLLDRHRERFGLPRSPERSDALNKLHRLDAAEWKDKAREQRTQWIDYARSDFQRAWRYPRPCAVCGLGEDYSHAHHSLPLSLQYELGVDIPIQEHDWLCAVHHKTIHRRISARLVGSRSFEDIDHYSHNYPSEHARLHAVAALQVVFEKAQRLFAEVGGVSPVGNWAMFSP